MTYLVQVRNVNSADDVIVLDAGLPTVKAATAVARKFRAALDRREWIVQVDCSEYRFARTV